MLKFLLQLCSILMLLILAGILSGHPGPTSVALAALPTRPLPSPTPTITPAPAASATATPTPTATPGCFYAVIHLDTVNGRWIDGTLLPSGIVSANSWSVVQWQGRDGQWHDVSGWSGLLQNGRQRWKVAQKDFGTGPFRWVVSDKTRIPYLVSQSFFPPASGCDVLFIRTFSKPN